MAQQGCVATNTLSKNTNIVEMLDLVLLNFEIVETNISVTRKVLTVKEAGKRVKLLSCTFESLLI